MAGFGSISLAQTAIGTLIDQRAVVLYKQPNEEVTKAKIFGKTKVNSDITIDWDKELWGNAWTYEELFAGLASYLKSDFLTKATNISGTNPYGISYVSAKVNKETDLCDHPIETGKVLTDSRIVQPVTAQVEVAMPTFFAERIYKAMVDLQTSLDQKIILQTKYGVYKNLVLQSFSYSLENSTVDRTVFTLILREVMEVEPYGEFNFMSSKTANIAKVSDSNTINTGTQVAGA